jgi:CheY-like chemotaxis protein
MSERKYRILLADDDRFGASLVADHLTARGISVTYVSRAYDILPTLEQITVDLVVLDIMMPCGRTFSRFETQGGFTTGLAVAKEIRQLHPQTKVIAVSQMRSDHVAEWFNQQDGCAFVPKGGDLWGTIKRLVGILEPPPPPPTVFIVHGRDRTTLSDVKRFLKKHGVKKVVVLAEKPNRGGTLLQKFVYYGKKADIAIVILTPDDRGYLIQKPYYTTDRARMNVIWEYGYFFGRLGEGRRVIVLRKGSVEIPTDISGIAYIDITDGVEQAGAQILAEIRDVRSTEPSA